jgi:hypothetical protein
MKLNTKLFATAVVLTGGLGLAGSAKADLVVDNFNNTGLAGYDTGPWANPAEVTPTPSVNGLDIKAVGIPASSYGSGYQNTASTLNAVGDGDLYVVLTFTVVSQTGSTQGGYIGPTVDLIDTSAGGGDALYNNFYSAYADGTHTVAELLTSAGAYTTTLGGNINQFRVGIDSQSDTGYEIIYNSVRLSSVPEPGTLALAGMGITGMFLARRRFAKA